jgi:protein-tyrosine-phosphatase
MFTAHTNYWNEMMEKMEENYKSSMNAGLKMQNNFVGVMKDIVETNMKYASDFKGRAVKVQDEIIGMTSENSKKIMDMYRENVESGLQAMKALQEKHHINNEEYLKDVENLWKEGMENYKRNLSTLTEMLEGSVKKNSTVMFDWYKEAFEKGMSDFNRRMEELSKTE